MNFGLKTVVWYDHSIKLWTAVRQDCNGYQIGDAGYGATKKLAISDLGDV